MSEGFPNIGNVDFGGIVAGYAGDMVIMAEPPLFQNMLEAALHD